MQYKKIILSLLFLISLHSISLAQRAEIGANIGGSGYIGDLNQFNPLKISGMNAGIFGKINFDPYWGLGLHFNYGEIKADDALSKSLDLQQRNLSFKTSLNEIAFIGSFNFIDIYSPGSRKRVTPYLFAGAGGVIFNPTTEYSNVMYKLRDLNTEGLATLYRNYAVVIPYGAGVKYKKSENWTLFGQVGYRTTFTDYLDDVSGRYPDKSVWAGTPPTFNEYLSYGSTFNSPYNPGDQRGDFRKRDTYLFVNIGISYTFVSQKCFTF